MDGVKFLEVSARELFAINGGFPPKKGQTPVSKATPVPDAVKKKTSCYWYTAEGQREILNQMVPDQKKKK